MYTIRIVKSANLMFSAGSFLCLNKGQWCMSDIPVLFFATIEEARQTQISIDIKDVTFKVMRISYSTMT